MRRGLNKSQSHYLVSLLFVTTLVFLSRLWAPWETRPLPYLAHLHISSFSKHRTWHSVGMPEEFAGLNWFERKQWLTLSDTAEKSSRQGPKNDSSASDPQEVPDDLSKSSCCSLLLVEAIIQVAKALMVGKNWRPFITISSGDRERNGVVQRSSKKGIPFCF